MNATNGDEHHPLDTNDLWRIKTAYEKFCETLDAWDHACRNDGRDPETGWTADEAIRAHYRSLSEVLLAYTAPNNWQRDDVAKAYLPLLAALTASNVVCDLVAGVLPSTIKRLFFGRGRSHVKAVQRHAIAAAVRYIEGTRAGHNGGGVPMRRVSERFKVTKHTVRRWVRENPADQNELSPQLLRKPGYLEKLERHMEENARRYRSSRDLKSK